MAAVAELGSLGRFTRHDTRTASSLVYATVCMAVRGRCIVWRERANRHGALDKLEPALLYLSAFASVLRVPKASTP